MTAEAETTSGGEIAEDASPREIFDHLLPEDRDRFVDAYGAALDRAKVTLELGPLGAMLDRWRAWALLQSDPADFADLVRTSAERLTGQQVPPGESLATTRRRIGW